MGYSFNNIKDALELGQTELYWRSDHLCRAPFSGFCIDAIGTITLCCMASSDNPGGSYYPNGKWPKIQEIENLTEFYNSEQMEYFRRELENKNGSNIRPCSYCFKTEKAGTGSTHKKYTNELQPMLGFDEDWDLRKSKKQMPIRWLELTTSNICNASCSTCTGFFSSKWNDVYKFFKKNNISNPYTDIPYKESKIIRLNDHDIQKIEKLLPDLSWLMLKGGEPFADKNNFRILKKLFDCNEKCKVTIISNFYKINPDMLKVLKKGRHQLVHVGASIDGIDKEYDWIRSNKFEETVKTMEQYHENVPAPIGINVFVSLHNFFSLDKIVKYFIDKPYVNSINLDNVASRSGDDMAFNLGKIPNNIFKKYLKKYMAKWEKDNLKYTIRYGHPFVVYNSLKNLYNTHKEFGGLDKEFQYIENMNKFRGFNLLDHCKGLKDLYGQTM